MEIMEAAPLGRGRRGWWARQWAKIAGEMDPVEAQLRAVAREGAGMARLAHPFSFVLIFLFSLASLLALGNDSWRHVDAQWRATGTVDIPNAVALGVTFMLVLCCDIGMVYAAALLRLLKRRRAGWDERWPHVAIMVSVILVEASTYVYMCYLFDAPTWIVPWALIFGRAVMAPVLSVYLSLAQALPVTPRDIMHQAETAAGTGVLRGIVDVAHDASATLADKAALFNAAAVMTADDRERLGKVIEVVSRRDGTFVVEANPTNRALREIKGAHDGWDGEDGYTDDSDPQMRAVVNGANGNGHRGGRGMSASRTGTMHALTAPVAAPDTVRFGPRQPAGSVQGGLRVPTANAAATAAAEWDVLPEEDGSPNVGGMYAPFSQPLPLPRPLHPSEHTPASKRATAARDTAKAADKAKAKGKAKQRREWQADAQAKVDPAASGLMRKQRMDANRPRTESQERFERAVDLAVDLLVARVGPEGEVLHDFHSARNRPLKRAVAQAMKREYDDSDGCSERVVERAEQRWRALMEQGLAPSGQIDDADEIAGLDGMLDEVDYAGDAEGYATTAFAVDDLTAFTDGDK